MVFSPAREDSTGRCRNHSMAQLRKQLLSSEHRQWYRSQPEEDRTVLERHRAVEQLGFLQPLEHRPERHLELKSVQPGSYLAVCLTCRSGGRLA